MYLLLFSFTPLDFTLIRFSFLFTISYNYPLSGGGKEDRTPDPLLAKQVLSQLSYTPVLVGLGRLELPTLRLSGVRSNHLSYKPSKGFATLIFFLKRICGRYIFSSLNGGDPAAGSPTATLLRLRPNR